MLKILMSGCNGKMGQVITRLAAAESDLKIIAGVSKQPDKIINPYPVYGSFAEVAEEANVVIDFSSPEVLPSLIKYCTLNKTALVLATTGLKDTDNEIVRQASEVIPIFRSANMSLGVNVLLELTAKASALLGESFDIEIIEKHHNEKKDAPSGTALMIAKEINQSLDNTKRYVFDRTSSSAKRDRAEIGISSVRGGTIPGEHTILFAGRDEILEIQHTALSRDIFGAGALKAARYISRKRNGVYDMKTMLKEMI
ncbi:MAG: 4-hydroxy-tetrahydrodipicolinate reductase [Bacillota bacterium]